MANKKHRTVLFRRKREQKTDYHLRLKLLLSKQLRIVVRFTNSKIIAQIVEFNTKGDKVIVATDSSKLKEMGWNYSGKNFPATYLTGLLLAKLAQKKGIKQAILDTGLKSPLLKGKSYAFLKGTVDGGLNVPHGDKDIFPNEEQLSGKNIVAYASSLKGKKEYDQRFSLYLKNKSVPEKMTEVFNSTKQKILTLK
ncbi:MAG: 50S ribosomal protein L18 [Candidatus Woesearchaeota archaeon]|jgi:large subunit ribosomal protein L18